MNAAIQVLFGFIVAAGLYLVIRFLVKRSLTKRIEAHEAEYAKLAQELSIKTPVSRIIKVKRK